MAYSFLYTANFDYIILNTTLTFGPSHPEQQCVQIAIVDDSLAEGLEQFTVEFTATSSAVNVTNSTLKIFIEPNDCKCQNSICVVCVCIEILFNFAQLNLVTVLKAV